MTVRLMALLRIHLEVTETCRRIRQANIQQ
jgi:hypothetical protein